MTKVAVMVAIYLVRTTLMNCTYPIEEFPHLAGAPSRSFLIWQVRTTLMNCTYPIEESILMDFVPADTRARWKVRA